MPAKISFFPVDNGDMTLVEFHDGKTLLIDTHIRADADDPEGDAPDVAADLKSRLPKDKNGRPYVDAFLLSHPDEDHILGFERHFHVGPLADYADDNEKDVKKKRIVIKELWSSPLVFRRASKEHTLCADAKLFNTEARRRVKANVDKNFVVGDGDRIKVLGEDIDGKTDKLTAILTKVDETITTINGEKSSAFSAVLLGPLPFSDDQEEEETITKNDSSVAINLRVFADSTDKQGCQFLTGGDAEVGIWERQWARHKKTPADLAYDLLQAPHHCSWHTLSWDSWGDLREKAQVSKEARNALSQAKPGAFIVSSSKAIKDDDKDPPCIRAKREYEGIVKAVKGTFMCTGEYPNEESPETLTFTVTKDGIQAPTKTEARAKVVAAAGAAATPLRHGKSRAK